MTLTVTESSGQTDGRRTGTWVAAQDLYFNNEPRLRVAPTHYHLSENVHMSHNIIVV